MEAHLPLLMGREGVDDAIHRPGRPGGMESGKDQMARFGGGNGGLAVSVAGSGSLFFSDSIGVGVGIGFEQQAVG